MTDIVDFNSITINTDNKQKLIEEFNKIDEKINNLRENGNDFIDEKFEELYLIFEKSKQRVKQKNFLTNNESKIFLDRYMQICSYEEEFYECYRILEYINLVGLFKNTILSKEPSFIRILIDSLADSDIILKEYPRVIPILLNKKIEELLERQKTDINKKDMMVDYIDQILNGYNLLEIYFYEIEDENTKFDDLTIGIITIDRIYIYYVSKLEELNSLKEGCIKNENMIYKIILIKSFTNEYQLKFINITQKIIKNIYGIVDQLMLMSILVDIYLKLGNKIEKYSEDNILTILCYSAINKIELDESIDIVNKKL